MQTSTSNTPENFLPPTLPAQLAALLQNHPGYDFVPLLALVTCRPPDQYEAFFNHVAELVCRHMHDGAWDNGYLLRILQELFRFRDAFRGMRGGAGWD